MVAILLSASLALIGQVAAGNAPRYSSETSPESVSQDVENPLRNAWSKDAPTYRGTATQTIPTQQPGQVNSNLSQDYRDQGALGTQPPLGASSTIGNDRNLSAPPKSNYALTNQTIEEVKPSQLIQNLLRTPTANQLEGSPISLAQAIEGASSRSEQTERVEAYWDLSAATANYYLALREVVALKTMQQSVMQPSPEWEKARQSLILRGKAARRTAQSAQVRLQRIIGQTGGPLPIATDLPHCGAYDTRYDEIFSGRLPSAEAQKLNELLPLERQEIRDQAAKVAAALRWQDTVSQRRNPDTDGNGLLKAHELLSLSRRAFVKSLQSYNTNIARYSEIATPGQVVTDRLVAMLIYSEDRNIQNIQTASSEQPLGLEEATPPRTFTEGQSDQPQALQPSGNGVERSILRGQ